MLDADIVEQFKASLFSGQYNLLLGSGASLDSTDKNGRLLKSASDLSKQLCELKGLESNTPLSRVSLLLEEEEIDKYLTKPYLGCRPGETVKRLANYVWKTIYTFNIDDALEAAYETKIHPKQKLEIINFDEPYRNPPKKNLLLSVHLHGFTRQWEKGYVFSVSEYGRITRGLNPWMHVLSELLASEPFIIAGTSLNESDLEYYLAGRSETTARTNRGPSILIEPYPNKLTELLCVRHGLTLVKTSLAEFLQWLSKEFERAPSVEELVVPSIKGIFGTRTSPEQQLIFSSDFELVRKASPCPEGHIPSFFYGKKPRWEDLESAYDVPTEDEQEITAKARNWLSSQDAGVKTICLISEPGTGKSTTLRRVAYEITKNGFPSFYLTSNAGLDVENFKAVASDLNRPSLIAIDNLADQAPSVRAILSTLNPKKPIVIISADRDYRRDHIERIAGDINIEYIHSKTWTIEKYEQLVEKLFKFGLLGSHEAVHQPKIYAQKLLGDSAAVANCRALNNFRPIEAIVRSVWKDASPDERRSYAIAALSEHCYSGGIFYPILEKAHPNKQLQDQLQFSCALPLAYADDSDYIYALHPVIADKLLHMLSSQKADLLFETFTNLSAALAPFVNRKATIARTPEARLAARLFSSESVVRPLLGKNAEKFFEGAHNAWKWNSRYWEQRALLTQSSDLETAIQYARHAVAIEEHPFPWTTLASLLAKQLESSNLIQSELFQEILELLQKVIRFETTNRSWRSTPHPYTILFHTTINFKKRGGLIPPKNCDWITQQMSYCERVFPRDTKLLAEIRTTAAALR